MNNYYNYNRRSQYKGAKKRLTLNILIIIAVVLATVAFSLILGNSLKNKLETADIDRDTGEVAENDTERSEHTGNEAKMFLKNGRTPEELREVGGFLDLSGYTSTTQAETYVEYLKSVGYSGIVFCVNPSGKLAYSSIAASALAGADIKGEMTTFELLNAAVKKGKDLGMRTTATVSLQCLFAKDSPNAVKEEILKAAAIELGRAGFEEFLFTDATDADDFTAACADTLFSFISEIKKEIPEADIGIVLDKRILDNPEMTPVTELVFGFADFFAIDFTDGTEESIVSEFLTSHSGSITAYNLRFLSGASSCDAVANDYRFFNSSENANISFLNPIEYTHKTDKDGKVDLSAKMPKYTLEKGMIADGNKDGDKDEDKDG